MNPVVLHVVLSSVRVEERRREEERGREGGKPGSLGDASFTVERKRK